MPCNHLQCSTDFRYMIYADDFYTEWDCKKGEVMPERTDTERIDWMDERGGGSYSGSAWWINGTAEQTIRQAIDAAMKLDKEAQDAAKD